jgi:hypothetical protein
MKINHEAAPKCNFCHYYSGSGYLPCAVRPSLQVDCPNFLQKEESDKFAVNTWVCEPIRYRLVPRRHIDLFPVIEDFGGVEIYGELE